MIDTIVELTEGEFAAQYKLRTNHLNPAAAWDTRQGTGCLFETYGDELAYVRRQNPGTIWTLIDGDDGDQYVLSGFHLVNRLGYLVSTVPVPEGTTIRVRIPIRFEKAAETTHTPEPWTYNHTAIVQDSQDTILADCEIIPPAGGTISPPAQEIANARRICAAVNACKGVSTEALEQGVVGELLEALKGCLFALDKNRDGYGPSKTQAIAAATAAISKTTRKAV